MFTLCRELSQDPTSNSTTQYGSFFYNKCTLYYTVYIIFCCLAVSNSFSLFSYLIQIRPPSILSSLPARYPTTSLFLPVLWTLLSSFFLLFMLSIYRYFLLFPNFSYLFYNYFPFLYHIFSSGILLPNMTYRRKVARNSIWKVEI